MRLEDALPALRDGRRARRESWQPGDYVTIELIGGVRSDHFTMTSRGSSHTWPGSQHESSDILKDDWVLLAAPVFEAYVPGNFRESFDIVLSLMSREVFDAYSDVRKSRSPGSRGFDVLKSDCDWRSMGEACLRCYMQAEAAQSSRVDRRLALARACVASLKALSYYLAEEAVEQVMRG